ncbi:dnaA protein helix-turn-helix [Devosia crocina]|uniref:DnaA protein helix-turn-helix n=1 Tax=Devosia crocina TaxID=429728 RepID=A0A1I7NMS4_9HYPH|nr:helix-turn-helix domain-containing protein [Devosia crocina]SFV35968.1 dnaA protein helix-turn-helix [Devosia crocina]
MRIDVPSATTPALRVSPPRASGDLGAVLSLVARERNVPIRILVHASRCRAQAARARQVAMYLAHVVQGLSLTAIGEAFGRDRTTVSYACSLIEDLRDDPALDAELDALEAQLIAMAGGDHG